jgi:hypothetical protein
VYFVLGLLTTLAAAWGSAALAHPTRAAAHCYTLSDWKENPEFGGYQFRSATVDRISWGLMFFAGSYSVAINPFTGALVNPDGTQISWAKELLPESNAKGLFPPWWGRAPRVETNGVNGRQFLWLQDARGWPMPALWCEWQDSKTGPSLGPVEGGIALGSPRPAGADFDSARALPCRPIWRGLAADTGFYSLAWWCLVRGTGSVRAALRRRRGRCVACSYDLSGLPAGAPCPECGKGAG